MPVLFLLIAMWLSGRAFMVDNFPVIGQKMTVLRAVILISVTAQTHYYTLFFLGSLVHIPISQSQKYP